MATIQKLTSLFGKTLKDRQGNKYQLISILRDDSGKPHKIIVENEDGMRSQRLASGKVRASAVTPRDILLKAPTGQRRATVNPFFDEDGIDDDEDDTFFTPRRTRRARYGSFVSPSNNLDDLEDDDFDINDLVDDGGPNFKSTKLSRGDVEITIKVKR